MGHKGLTPWAHPTASVVSVSPVWSLSDRVEPGETGELTKLHRLSVLCHVWSLSGSTAPENTGGFNTWARSTACVVSVLLCGLCLAALPQGTQGHIGTEGLTTYGVTQGFLHSVGQCLRWTVTKRKLINA